MPRDRRGCQSREVEPIWTHTCASWGGLWEPPQRLAGEGGRVGIRTWGAHLMVQLGVRLGSQVGINPAVPGGEIGYL